MLRLLVWEIILCIMLPLGTHAEPKTEYLGLGTAEITGVYYQAGGAIAQIINSRTNDHGTRIIVEPTAGSAYNVNAVANGKLPLAIVQSDTQHMAMQGAGQWLQTGKQKGLRSIFSLYPESVTIVARKQAGIKNLNDLKGKKVNLGSLESGTYQNALDILRTIGLNPATDLVVSNHSNSVAADMLSMNRIDALFMTVGHPSKLVEKLLTYPNDLELIPVTDVDKLLDMVPYYSKTMIPSELYPALQSNVLLPSIGVRAALVCSAELQDGTVYSLTKEIFTNFEQFKALHPVFSTLSTADMLEGCVFPFHKGAMKYYKQALLKKK